MISQHTPCRLQLDDAQPVDILLAESEGSPYAMAIVPLEGKVRDAKSEAKARRLLACWNACEGLSTQFLEACVSQHPQSIKRLFRDFEVSERGLLEALLALHGWCKAEKEHFDSTGPDEWIMEKARAAIAKAGGDA